MPRYVETVKSDTMQAVWPGGDADGQQRRDAAEIWASPPARIR